MKKITVDARLVCASGIGTYLSNLLPRLITSMSDCNFCLLGSSDELKKFKEYSNVTIIDFNAPIYSIKEQIQLYKLIEKDTDLFWAPHYNLPMFYRGKLLVTVHDVFHLAMQQFVEGKLKKIYAHYMFHLVKRKATRVIAVSNFTKHELVKYVGLEESKIEVTYNGVSQSWFNINSEIRSIDKPYLIFVGNIKPHKNLKILIKGFEMLKDKIPHDLIIVGKKEGFLTGDPEITKLISSNPRIKLTGFVEEKKLKELVKHADLFLFPSLYEGFGIPPLEAMACGTPSIVSNIPVLKEIYQDQVCYFDPMNPKDIATQIYSLIKNPDRLKNMIKDGKKFASKFTWQTCASRTESVIKNLL